jgi:hypothetical protein
VPYCIIAGKHECHAAGQQRWLRSARLAGDEAARPLRHQVQQLTQGCVVQGFTPSPAKVVSTVCVSLAALYFVPVTGSIAASVARAAEAIAMQITVAEPN